jgi:hypothetical protein
MQLLTVVLHRFLLCAAVAATYAAATSVAASAGWPSSCCFVAGSFAGLLLLFL